MPQLDSKTADKAAKAEAWGDSPQGGLLPEAWYVGELAEVKVIGGESGRWDWIFDIVSDEDGNPKTGKAFWTTNTTDKAIGKLNGTFGAFDADTDANTDELLGDKVLLYLDQHVYKGVERNGMQAIKQYAEADGTEGSSKSM